MTAIFDVFMLPFSMFFRLVAKQPWPAVVLSALAAVGAHLVDNDVIAVNLVMFSSIVLVWIDEKSRPANSEFGTAAGD